MDYTRRPLDAAESLRVAQSNAPPVHLHDSQVAPGVQDPVRGFTRETDHLAKIPLTDLQDHADGLQNGSDW